MLFTNFYAGKQVRLWANWCNRKTQTPRNHIPTPLDSQRHSSFEPTGHKFNVLTAAARIDSYLDKLCFSRVPERRVLILVPLEGVLGIQGVDTHMAKRRVEEVVLGAIL